MTSTIFLCTALCSAYFRSFSASLYEKEEFTEVAYVNKSYASYSCKRNNTKETVRTAILLNSLIQANSSPVICSAGKLRRRKTRETLSSWTTPNGLPNGTQIAFCHNFNKCCMKKKTLNAEGTHYNLCRECIHLVILPVSYYPSQHHHVTCQDEDYSESCFSGEGDCTTNIVKRAVIFNASQEFTFIFGHSCSCEIRKDSIFSDFV